MVLGWEASAGWQWVFWICLMAFFCFGFGTIFWALIVGLDRYEEAWWNKKPVVWILLGLFVGFSFGPPFSNALLHFFFRHPVVPESLPHIIKATIPDNRMLIAGDRLAEDFLFSFFILIATLGVPRSTTIKEWTSDHFVLCLAGVFLFWWGLKVLLAYFAYLLIGGQILGFDIWEAIFRFRGRI
jgi:hypothetical protein